jgi:ATP-dependent DNA ligase
MLAPNTAVDFDDAKIKFPVFASVKFDGMRIKIMPCTVSTCKTANIYSRQHRMQCGALHNYFDRLLKLVQSQQIVLDGNLWAPCLTSDEIMSALVKPITQHKLQFQVFDMMTVDEWYNGTEQPFIDRVAEYTSWVKRFCGHMLTGHLDATRLIEHVDQYYIKTPEGLEEFFTLCIKRGHEGCMVRGVQSKYKHGRGTLNEGTIFKFKKWVTEDAKIVGFKPATRMKSEFLRERDELGVLKPIKKPDQRVPVEAIGWHAMLC